MQRVSRASVSVEGHVIGSIGPGLCVLLGVAQEDTAEQAAALAAKVARLRIFGNEAGRFDRSLVETGGSALVISQFTLIADTGKGNRPSFTGAAIPEHAEPLYELFLEKLRQYEIEVESGRFGAAMLVELANDGPVTLVVDR